MTHHFFITFFVPPKVSNAITIIKNPRDPETGTKRGEADKSAAEKYTSIKKIKKEKLMNII